jgi:hypothetical protein
MAAVPLSQLYKLLSGLMPQAVPPGTWEKITHGQEVSDSWLKAHWLLHDSETVPTMDWVALPLKNRWLEYLGLDQEGIILNDHLIVSTQRVIDHIVCKDQRIKTVRINLELSGTCNLHCHYCSLDPKLPDRGKNAFITIENLHKAFDKIFDNPRYQIEGKISLWNGGEPLLHPQFMEILDVLAQRKQRSKKKYEFALLTNASLLTPQRTRKILDSGAISEMLFSLDGGNPQTFEKFRQPARWDQISKKIHHFLDENEKLAHPIPTRVNMVLDPSVDQHEMSPEFKELEKRITFFDKNYPQSEAGNKPGDYIDRYDLSEGLCAWMKAHQYVILWNGKVTMCCSDLNGVMQMGDLDHFDDIYDGEIRRTYLRKMLKGQRHTLKGCKGCNQPEILPTSDGSGFWDEV